MGKAVSLRSLRAAVSRETELRVRHASLWGDRHDTMARAGSLLPEWPVLSCL